MNLKSHNKSIKMFVYCIVFFFICFSCFLMVLCNKGGIDGFQYDSAVYYSESKIEDQNLRLHSGEGSFEMSKLFLAEALLLETQFAQSPEWFRRCPALYIPMPLSAGAVMLSFGGRGKFMLPDLIDSFRDMPKLLEEARSLGTNTIYLVDYYEGWQGQAPKAAWLNKGDYIPRTDLGGAAAFNEGVAAIHRSGGRVIVYVEGFIISKQSQVGQEHGEEWAILMETGTLGPLVEPYQGYWKMCSACQGWIEHVVDVCRRLVSEYGVDGIHIDSYGAQKDYRCVNPAHKHDIGKPQVFNDGCVELVRQVRAVIQKENPEAIVIVELPYMLSLFEVVDGCQDWGIHALCRGPLWEKAGMTDVFTAGWSIDDIHQILAIGHKLSLGRFWIADPEGLSCTTALKSQELIYKQEKSYRSHQGQALVQQFSMVLYKWWNAGLLLNLPMPNLEDLNSTIQRWMANSELQTEQTTGKLLVQISQRAGDIDVALKDHSKTSLLSPADHIKDLLSARSKLSHIIDDGSTVQELNTGYKKASAYYFTSTEGSALMVVNVSNNSMNLTLCLPNDSDFKHMIDEQKEVMIDVQEGILTVSSPAHSIRMFRGFK